MKKNTRTGILIVLILIVLVFIILETRPKQVSAPQNETISSPQGQTTPPTQNTPTVPVTVEKTSTDPSGTYSYVIPSNWTVSGETKGKGSCVDCGDMSFFIIHATPNRTTNVVDLYVSLFKDGVGHIKDLLQSKILPGVSIIEELPTETINKYKVYQIDPPAANPVYIFVFSDGTGLEINPQTFGSGTFTTDQNFMAFLNSIKKL